MRYILLVSLFFSFTILKSQATTTVALAEIPTEAAVKPTTPVMNRLVPAFPGGPADFKNFLTENLEYPELASDYAVEGTVVVKVLVNAAGEVSVKGIQQSLFAPLDEAALGAAARLPRMLPAIVDGKPVARTMYIPFKFSLR